jgi:hypothetical protein
MGAILKFFKALVGGIISFITDLFSGKKKSEFFLEAEPASPAGKGSQAAAPKSAAAQKSAKPAVPVAAATAVAATLAMPTVSDSSAIIQTALNQSKTASVVAAAESGFATKYLAPMPRAGRRRPGPVMNTYLSMAKEMKKRV